MIDPVELGICRKRGHTAHGGPLGQVFLLRYMGSGK